MITTSGRTCMHVLHNKFSECYFRIATMWNILHILWTAQRDATHVDWNQLLRWMHWTINICSLDLYMILNDKTNMKNTNSNTNVNVHKQNSLRILKKKNKAFYRSTNGAKPTTIKLFFNWKDCNNNLAKNGTNGWRRKVIWEIRWKLDKIYNFDEQ